MEHFMSKYEFPNLLQSDFLLAEYNESDTRLGMDIVYAYAHQIPIYLIAKAGTKISSPLKSIAERVIFYDQISDIISVFQEMLTQQELKLKIK